MANPQVGFIGLGIMGRPQCHNLIKAGFPLIVWNRSQPGIETVVGYGALPGRSPADVAAKSDVTITMVTDSPDVREVVLGPNGVIEGARPGSVVIDMSTISPAVTREIAEALRARDVQMLDAPVSGGEVRRDCRDAVDHGGRRGGGVRPLPAVLEAMGKNIVHIGPNGAGQTVKLCNQVAAVLNILGMCEALILAARSGVDPEKMLQAVTAGAAGSWMLANLAPRILKGDFAPGFMIRLQQKDLRLALEAAAR